MVTLSWMFTLDFSSAGCKETICVTQVAVAAECTSMAVWYDAPTQAFHVLPTNSP